MAAVVCPCVVGGDDSSGDGTFVYITMSISFLFLLVLPWRRRCRCIIGACIIWTTLPSSVWWNSSATVKTTMTTTASDSEPEQSKYIEMAFIFIAIHHQLTQRLIFVWSASLKWNLYSVYSCCHFNRVECIETCCGPFVVFFFRSLFILLLYQITNHNNK